jgi:hypothetical protein
VTAGAFSSLCLRRLCLPWRQPAGLARQASSFLLLAQKIRTKEEGLNTIWADVLEEGSICAGRSKPEPQARLAFALEFQHLFNQRNALSCFNGRLWSLATSTSQIVFRPFALVTFIWARK